MLPELFRLGSKTLGSPAMRTAAWLAAGGIGFALGTLLLARILPEDEFGVVALSLAFVQVGAALGSLGLPTLVNRYVLPANRQLLHYSLAISLVAVVIVAVAARLYGLPDEIAYLIGCMVALAAMARTTASLFQSRRRFGTSLLLTQVHNWMLLASVPVVIVTGSRSAILVLTIVLCSYLLATLLGWRSAARLPGAGDGVLSTRMLWTEGLSAAGFGLAINLYFQADRLVIGGALPIEELAAYSVVIALVGAPFRMLQVAAGYTLIPRLRRVASRAAALHLIGHEGAVVFGTAAFVAAPLLYVTQWLAERALAGRYAISFVLILAVMIVGFIRVWEGFSAAVVSAIGSARELFAMNVLAWLAVLLGVIVASNSIDHGLVAIVYALGAGWLALAIGASVLAMLALRRLSADTEERHF